MKSQHIFVAAIAGFACLFGGLGLERHTHLNQNRSQLGGRSQVESGGLALSFAGVLGVNQQQLCKRTSVLLQSTRLFHKADHFELLVFSELRLLL